MTDLATKQEIEIYECSMNDRHTHVTVDYSVSDRDSEATLHQQISMATLLNFAKENGLNVLEHFSGVDVEPAALDLETYVRENLTSVVREYLEEMYA